MSETEDAEGWSPDLLLVPAILAGSPTTMSSLKYPDRAWVVAVLKRQGHTAEQIADWLDCSVRSVRAVWSDAGVLVALYLDEAEHFSDEQRMATSEVARLSRTLADAERDRDRYHGQFSTMLDTLMTEGTVRSFPCGCPRTRYNTYVAPKTGKAGCREHRRLAVARHRATKRAENAIV